MVGKTLACPKCSKPLKVNVSSRVAPPFRCVHCKARLVAVPQDSGNASVHGVDDLIADALSALQSIDVERATPAELKQLATTLKEAHAKQTPLEEVLQEVGRFKAFVQWCEAKPVIAAAILGLLSAIIVAVLNAVLQGDPPAAHVTVKVAQEDVVEKCVANGRSIVLGQNDNFGRGDYPGPGHVISL